MEGGFYGIISATGEKLLPLNLSEAYYQAGAKVRFKAEKANVETIQQWGTPVTILAIELIAPPKANRQRINFIAFHFNQKSPVEITSTGLFYSFNLMTTN